MTIEKSEVRPRYEFRLFARNLGRETDEIRSRAPCREIGEVRDVYLVTAAAEIHNVKIRGGSAVIKKLLGIEQGLELWQPSAKLDFPAASSAVENVILTALEVQAPLPAGDSVTAEHFLRHIVYPHPQVNVAQVFKRRFHFAIGRSMVEIDELLVNGAAIESIAIECEEGEEVLRVRQLLDLKQYENTSYLLALKRIMGIIPQPPRFWLLQ